MFQLIVAVISIALVAILAIASIYYGGSAFTQSSAKAQADTVVNAAVQIEAANTLYETDNGTSLQDGATPGSAVARLADGSYLKSAPAMPAIAAKGAVWRAVKNDKGNTVFAIDLGDGDPTAVCKALFALGGGCVTDPSLLASH